MSKNKNKTITAAVITGPIKPESVEQPRTETYVITPAVFKDAHTVGGDVMANAAESISKTLWMNIARGVSSKMANDPSMTQRLLHAGFANAAYAATKSGTGMHDLTRGVAFGMNAVALDDFMAIVGSQIKELSADESTLFAEMPFPVCDDKAKDAVKFSTAAPAEGVVATEAQRGLIKASSALPMPLAIDDAPATSGREKFDAAIGKEENSAPLTVAANVCPRCTKPTNKNKLILFRAADDDIASVKKFDNHKVCKNCNEQLSKERRDAKAAEKSRADSEAALVKKQVEYEAAYSVVVAEQAKQEKMEASVATADELVKPILEKNLNEIKASVMKHTNLCNNIDKAIKDIETKLGR